jgi:hypothetical protein
MRANSYFFIISFYVGVVFAQVSSFLEAALKDIGSDIAPQLLEAMPTQDLTTFLSLLTSNVTLLVPL